MGKWVSLRSMTRLSLGVNGRVGYILLGVELFLKTSCLDVNLVNDKYPSGCVNISGKLGNECCSPCTVLGGFGCLFRYDSPSLGVNMANG